MYVQGSMANDSESHVQILVSLYSVYRSTCTNQSHTAQPLTLLTEMKTTESRPSVDRTCLPCLCRAVWTLPVELSLKADGMSALRRQLVSPHYAHRA